MRTAAAEVILTAAVCLVLNPIATTYLVTIPMEPHSTEAINTNKGASLFIGHIPALSYIY